MSRLLWFLTLGSRLFLAGVFLYASYDKVWDPAAFASAVAAYDLLPLWAVNPASVLLAWLELVVGLLLLAGVWVRPAAAWAVLMLLLFMAVSVYAGLTGAGYDCGCFPGQEGGHAAGFGAALRDLGFLLPALWLLWRGESNPSPARRA